jgi:hypothetical protein
MFTLPSKKTILAALPFIASAGAVPCVQFDADWSLYAFGGSEDVKLGGSGSWGCKLLLYFLSWFKLIGSTQSSDFDYFRSTVSPSFHRAFTYDCAED